MQSADTDEITEKLVIPLFEIVLYPGSLTKFRVEKALGEKLVYEMNNSEAAYAIGLTVKSGTEPSEVSEAAFYTTGNLLRIMCVQPNDDGYLVAAKSVHRVRALSLHLRDGAFYTASERVLDLPDLAEDIQAGMLAEIKKIVHEISGHFQGSEQFTRPIDKMDSIDQILGFILPFMPIDLSAKQDLLEIVSLERRHLAFLEILMTLKENINIRIEMAKKVSDKVAQVKPRGDASGAAQGDPGRAQRGDGAGSGDGGYREKIEQSKMPDEVRKKALSELKKLETGGSQNHESPVIRNYLDLLLDLPWVTEEKKNIDIAGAKRYSRATTTGSRRLRSGSSSTSRS